MTETAVGMTSRKQPHDKVPGREDDSPDGNSDKAVSAWAIWNTGRWQYAVSKDRQQRNRERSLNSG